MGVGHTGVGFIFARSRDVIIMDAWWAWNCLTMQMGMLYCWAHCVKCNLTFAPPINAFSFFLSFRGKLLRQGHSPAKSLRQKTNNSGYAVFPIPWPQEDQIIHHLGTTVEDPCSEIHVERKCKKIMGYWEVSDIRIVVSNINLYIYIYFSIFMFD